MNGHKQLQNNQIDSSDFEEGDDEYEEVGFEDYEEDDEREAMPPPQTDAFADQNGQKRRSSLILKTTLNELQENVKESDEDYSDENRRSDPTQYLDENDY